MKLAKASILYRTLRNSLSFGVIFVLSTSVQEVNSIAALSIMIGASLIVGVNLVWQYLIWRNYDLNLENNDLRINKGVLSRENRKIPFDRIQNVDIKRNLVHRLMGISKLNVETAGGNKTEASIKHLTSEDAERLSIKLSGDTEDKTKIRSPEYRIRKRELVPLSLTSIDGRVIAVIGAIFGVAPSIVGSAIEKINLDPSISSPTVLILGVGSVWALSTVSTFLKYWGFELYKNENTLNYKRGMLNRVEGEIPLQKVQKLTVEENLVQRIFGYASLKIDTAGYSPAQSAAKGPEAAVPLAKRSKVEKILYQVTDTYNVSPKGITKKARRRYFFRYGLASLVVGSSIVYFYPSNTTVTVVVTTALTGVSAVAAHFKWKNIGYSIVKDHVITSKGFWNSKRTYVPFFRVQNLIETRSILQRRWGVSTLDIDTAGTDLLSRTHIPDLSVFKARELRQEIFRRFQKSVQEGRGNQS